MAICCNSTIFEGSVIFSGYIVLSIMGKEYCEMSNLEIVMRINKMFHSLLLIQTFTNNPQKNLFWQKQCTLDGALVPLLL